MMKMQTLFKTDFMNHAQFLLDAVAEQMHIVLLCVIHQVVCHEKELFVLTKQDNFHLVDNCDSISKRKSSKETAQKMH